MSLSLANHQNKHEWTESLTSICRCVKVSGSSPIILARCRLPVSYCCSSVLYNRSETKENDNTVWKIQILLSKLFRYQLRRACAGTPPLRYWSSLPWSSSCSSVRPWSRSSWEGSEAARILRRSQMTRKTLRARTPTAMPVVRKQINKISKMNIYKFGKFVIDKWFFGPFSKNKELKLWTII